MGIVVDVVGVVEHFFGVECDPVDDGAAHGGGDDAGFADAALGQGERCSEGPAEQFADDGDPTDEVRSSGSADGALRKQILVHPVIAGDGVV
jgi:hypothetical protein